MKSIVMIIVLVCMGCNIDNSKPDSSIYDFVDNKELAKSLIGVWNRDNIDIITFNEAGNKFMYNDNSYVYAIEDYTIFILVSTNNILTNNNPYYITFMSILNCSNDLLTINMANKSLAYIKTSK